MHLSFLYYIVPVNVFISFLVMFLSPLYNVWPYDMVWWYIVLSTYTCGNCISPAQISDWHQTDKMSCTLYVIDGSPPARAAWMACRAMGMDLTIKRMDFSKGEQFSDWFLKVDFLLHYSWVALVSFCYLICYKSLRTLICYKSVLTGNFSNYLF